MSAEDLKTKIEALLKPGESPSPFDEAVAKLREISTALGAALAGVEVVLEPGPISRRGQQFSFVLRAEKPGLRDVLFRATVPDSGFPVVLDLFEEDTPSCEDAAALEKAVLGFLANPMVVQRLRLIKSAAAA